MGYKLNFLKDPNLNDTQQTNHGGLMSKEFSAIKVCIFVQQWNLEVRKKEKKNNKPKSIFQCFATSFSQSRSKVDFLHNISICTSSSGHCGTGQKHETSWRASVN